MTRFKELCIDTARDDTTLARFWAAVTGCAYAEPRGPGDVGDVLGEVEGMGIAMCPVPEEKTVKHRVHLDVHTDSVDGLVALGASVLRPEDDEIGWTLMADPEGGEFCAFLRERPPAYRTYELVIDAVDPRAVAMWWGDVFDVIPANEGQPWWWLEGVPGVPFDSFVFQPVPEPKTVKNRVHWDVYGEVDDLVGRGAVVLAELPGWTVLADPEGNEFCVFAPPAG